jgi:hypothetical protein
MRGQKRYVAPSRPSGDYSKRLTLLGTKARGKAGQTAFLRGLCIVGKRPVVGDGSAAIALPILCPVASAKVPP